MQKKKAFYKTQYHYKYSQQLGKEGMHLTIIKAIAML